MTRPEAEVSTDSADHQQLERLRSLLLVDERTRQLAMAGDIERLRERLAALPQLLPDAIDASHQAGQRLSRALLKPVGLALGNIARHEPQVLVSVLFPVIGPIIRRAIADALASMMRNLNQTLEHSFSLRSWRWRLESWRTGVPFAQVVLKHTLSWRVEHLLWIEGGSGLLLAHATNSDAQIADRDAIAGMLTAISDFVRDAVLARPGEELERVEMGEFSVRLLRTPQAYLAAVVRGEAGAVVLESLRALSEELHAGLDPEPRNYSDATEARLAQWLNDSGKAQAQREGAARPGHKRPPWLALLLVLVLLVWLGIWGWQRYQLSQRTEQFRRQLAAEPGIEVQRLRFDGRNLWLRGLRDPLSADDPTLAARLELPPESLQTRWQQRLSLEPELFRRRLLKLLAPPAGVQVEVLAEGLIVHGEWPDAPAELETRLDVFRAFLPVDSSALKRPSAVSPPTPPVLPPTAPVLDLAALDRELEQLDVIFTGEQPDALASERVEQLATRVKAALALRPDLQFEAIGDSDGVGGAERNTALRALRSQWLREALLAAGVPANAIRLREATAPLGEQRYLPARRAYLQVASAP